MDIYGAAVQEKAQKDATTSVVEEFSVPALATQNVFGPSCAVFVNVFNSSDSAGFVHYKHPEVSQDQQLSVSTNHSFCFFINRFSHLFLFKLGSHR